MVSSPTAGLYANDHLFYVRDGVWYAHGFDPRSLELEGEPVSIAPNAFL